MGEVRTAPPINGGWHGEDREVSQLKLKKVRLVISQSSTCVYKYFIYRVAGSCTSPKVAGFCTSPIL